MMKVRFDATLEDYVDVGKRSAGSRFRVYVFAVFSSLLVGGLIAELMYLMFRDWLITVMIVSVTVSVTIVTTIAQQESNMRAFFKKRVKLTLPISTEFEITQAELTSRALGQTVSQEWKVIENIEETDDAIYFRNIFGLYTAVRKRGFADDEELTEFLTLAKSYWSDATIPKPPSFEEANS